MRSRFARALCAVVVLGLVACSKSSGPTPDCSNYKRDGNETDVDCGGSICGACGTGKTCKVDRDCISKLCNSDGRCNAATCSDGIKNGSETDIDCGGPDCQACASGKKCSASDDCQRGACDFDAGLCP
jgi:hypothetical protein